MWVLSGKWMNFFHSFIFTRTRPGHIQRSISPLSGKQCFPGKGTNNQNFQCWVKWGPSIASFAPALKNFYVFLFQRSWKKIKNWTACGWRRPFKSLKIHPNSACEIQLVKLVQHQAYPDYWHGFFFRFSGPICSCYNGKGGWYLCIPQWHDGDWLYSSL